MGSGASKNKASTTISQNAELPPDEGKGHLDEVQTIQIQSESPEKGLSAANSKQSQEPKQQLNVVNQPTQQIGQGNQPNPQIGQQPGPSWQTEHSQQTIHIQSESPEKGLSAANSKQSQEPKQQLNVVNQPTQQIGQGNQPNPQIGQQPGPPWQTEHSQRQRWQNDQRPNQQWWTGNQPDIQSWQTKPQPYQQWQPQQQPHQYLGAGGPPNSSWHAPQQPYHYWQREQPPNQQLQVGQQPYQSWQTERLPSSPWQAGLHATQWSEGRPSSHPWPAEHQPNQSWQQPSQQQNPHWQEMYQHHQSGRPEQIPNPQMQPRQQPFEHLGKAHQPPNPNWRAEPHSYHPWEREQPPNPNWQTENPLDPMWETGRQSPFCNSGQKPFELVHTGHPLNATTQIRKQPNHLQPNSKFEAERPMHPAQCQAVQPFQNIPYQPGNLQQPLQSAHDQFQAGKKASQPSQPSQISEENYPDRQNKECQPQRSRGESKETMSIPVEPDVMQFIYGSSYSEELAKLKYERGIKVTWEAGSELAEIVSEGHRSPQLQTESIKAVGSFIQKFVRVDIPVKKEIWAEVQKQLPKVRATLSDSLIKSFEPQLTLKIVSLRSNIDSCRNRLEAHLEKIYKEVTFQQEVISSSKEGFIILLKAMDVHEMLRQENCQEVEFELDQKNQEVHLAGPCDQIKIAKQVFNDLMGKAAERPIGLDCDVLTILAKEDAQKTVEKAFKEQNIEATMLVSGYRASKVLARSEKHAANAVFLISGMVKKGEVRYTAKHSSLIASKAWDDYCKSTEIKANVIINKDSTGTTCIFGLKDNVETAVRRLQFFLDNSSEREEEIKCFSADSREYLLRRRKADIENFGVKIREGDGTSTFYISGQEIPLKNAEDFLNGIIKDVTVSEVHFQQPGLVKFDESGKLDEQVKELEEKEKCFIRVEKHLISTSPPVQRGNQFLTRSHFRSALARNNHSLALSSLSSLVDSTIHVTKQGQRISWKLGDITKEKVDALVIPQGACFNKIRSDFDSTTCQAVDELKFGEIATSTGVSLPCSHVIHTCCAFWNGPSGNGEGTLRAIVHKSLNEAGQLGGNSIAFPIIGTGNLLFPIHDACRIMLEEAVKFCESYPYSVVKDIRFIVFDRDQSLIDAFKQEVVMIKKGSGCVKNPGAEKWLSVIEVANGDLTQETTDAIVNINSTSLNMNAAGELSKAVANASGPQVQQECNQLGSQAPGSAVITSGGNLNVRHIIHIVPGSSDKSHLQQCLEEGLRLADKKNVQSISVPTIGTGGYGLSASDSAEVIFKAVRNASASFTSISKVRLVIYQSKILPVFQQEKQKYLTAPLSSVPQSVIAGRGISIDVINGDLTQENTDAIVNINSTSLNMNAAGELSKAVANASGPQVQQECNQLGSQAPGSAVITSGGNLNVRHIIHIVPGSSDKSHLQQCLEEGLQLADGNNLQSISVPTIGTGGYGLSASDSAEVTFQAVRNASASLTSISKVRIIVYQATMMSFFQQEKVRLHTQQISSTGPSLASMDVSSQTKKSAVRLWVTGKNKASVDAAINGLKKAFTEACTSKHIKNEAISSLSQRQINKLEQEAFKSDVEIKFDEVAKCVTVRGYIQKIPDIVNKIMEEINEGMRLEKQSQENEHANVVAKMVEWSYEKQGKNINFDPKTNAKLETANGKKELSVKVDILGKEFVIDLKGNIGYCSRDGEQIKVYRSTKEGVPLPKHWSPMPYGKEVHLEQLVPGSPEYQDVICKVQATVAGVNILKIERIQNPALYQAYIVKKEKLDKIVNGNTEKQLFHGTDGKNITKINTQGFNRSLAGKNGTAYGYGVYFARDALYSYRYALGNPGFRKMYLARVLVGRYCQGRPGMLTPPPLNVQRPELLFDSVVDNPAQPTIFVVFHDSSCFPEYLLTF